MIRLAIGFWLMLSAFSVGAYDIRVQVDGMKNGDTCLLGHYYGATQFVKDTSFFDLKSEARFNADEDLEEGMYLIILNDSTYMEFVVDQDQKFHIYGERSVFPKGVKFKGSEQNSVFYDYMASLDDKRRVRTSIDSIQKAKADRGLQTQTEQAQLQALNNEVLSINQRYVADHPSWLTAKLLRMSEDVDIPEDVKSDQARMFYYYRAHFWDKVDLSDDRLLLTPDFHPKLNVYIDQLTVQYPDSVIRSMNKLNDLIPEEAESIRRYFYDYIIRKYQEPKKMGTDAVFAYLIDNYLGYEKTPWVDTANYLQLKFRADHLRLNSLGMIGQDFTAVKPSGSYFRLHALDAEFVILFFYNYTCNHCQANTPKIKALFDKYRTQGLRVVAFNTNEELEPWLDYIEKNELESIVNVADVHGNTEFRKKYNVLKVPQLYLLNSEKRIIAKGLTPDQIDQFISYELNKS